MAPIEDFQSRDLAWISDFIMQQMMIMMRPMMEHLQQTDASVDYAQHTMERLSIDVSEVRSDLERANRYLSILRQGLGLQNEGRCMLQRSVESSTRATKRLDEQMEGIIEAMRDMENTMSRIVADSRANKNDDLWRQVTDNVSALDDLQAKVDTVACDTHKLKEDMLNNEARLEGWQRELRDVRRMQLGLVGGTSGAATKFEEKAPPSSQSGRPGVAAAFPTCSAAESAWPQKKNFSPMDASSKEKDSYVSANNGSDRGGSREGKASSSKRSKGSASAMGGASKQGLLAQEAYDFSGPPSRASRSAAATDNLRSGLWAAAGSIDAGALDQHEEGYDEQTVQSTSRLGSLPLLTAVRQPPASATRRTRPWRPSRNPRPEERLVENLRALRTITCP
eukprot:TRINITY_DN20835_c0_g2_i5.p1 TRINITY_DN20835_c0_g2~~TRINITY_DN20835_c0_g2_i5.p1  ORF type:complete len:394 (-),score=82.38 TRINITY_DN20835_c0_g2_i5:314-1495(-)